jgi:predicted kinase
MAEVPAFLGPRLPMDFTDHDREPTGSGLLLIVFSGVPGAGKTTLADAVARKLRIPAFSGDWLLGALSPFGGYHLNNLAGIADELLTTVAFRQLQLDQSVILDSPAENISTRDRWRSLAESQGARLRVIVCVCSDASIHRSRAEGRRRQIPGWHDPAEWANIERRLLSFQRWEGEALTVDSVCSLEQNLAAVLDYLSGP